VQHTASILSHAPGLKLCYAEQNRVLETIENDYGMIEIAHQVLDNRIENGIQLYGRATLLKIQDSHPPITVTHPHSSETKNIAKKYLNQAHNALRWMTTTDCKSTAQINSNIIYFNCACATLICLNQNKQNDSHNTPLRELGRDQFNQLHFLRPRIRIKYRSLLVLVTMLRWYIILPSSPNTFCFSSLGLLFVVYFQNVSLGSRVVAQ
jgi:hypothetical protein